MFDFGLGAGAFAAIFAAAFLGTMLQRLAGQGFGMLAAPVLAMIAPEFLPASLLIVGIVVGVSSGVSNFNAVQRRDLPPGFAGRTLGAILAAALAAQLHDTGAIAYVVAAVIYTAIALNLSGLRAPITAPSLFTAGTAAGVMGTLTAVGAPPMAILYAQVEQRRSAATQNVFFGFGMIVSITALAIGGLVTLRHIAFALALLPAVPLALWAARPLAQRVEKRSIRPWALGLAGTAATLLLIRQLL